MSKNLSGNSFANIFVLVAVDKSASSTTILGFSFPNSANALHNFVLLLFCCLYPY